MTASLYIKIFRSDLHRLDARFAVRFQLKRGRFDAVWHPAMPTHAQAQPLLPAYLAAREEFLADGARRTGIPMAVLTR